MRSGWPSNVVGKASTIVIDVSLTPPLIFKKCEIWRRLKHHSTLSRSRLKMQQDQKSETKVQCCDDRRMSLPSLAKLTPRTLEKALVSSAPPPKITRETVLNRL